MNGLRILSGEMRRYVWPFTLIFTAVLLLLWNVVFGLDSFTLEKGTDGAIDYDLSVEYARRFGETIDPDERRNTWGSMMFTARMIVICCTVPPMLPETRTMNPKTIAKGLNAGTRRI